MVQKITGNILGILIKNNAVKEEQKAIIAFGIEQGLRTAIEIGLLLITGLFMNVFWQSIVILLSFTHVRIYAGGYHAKTPLECALESWALFVIVILCHKYVSMYWGVQVMIMAITGIWLYLFCPVQDVHKPLNEYEIHRYKKRAIRNFYINIFLFIIGYIWGKEEFALCITMGMVMLLPLLVMGSIKNRTIVRGQI